MIKRPFMLSLKYNLTLPLALVVISVSFVYLTLQEWRLTSTMIRDDHKVTINKIVSFSCLNIIFILKVKLLNKKYHRTKGLIEV